MSDSVVDVATHDDLVSALGRAGDTTRAILLVGGADFTETERLAELRGFFALLAGYLDRTGTAVVDGGTDSGVMRLIADARRERDGAFPLVGVAPRGAFDRTTRTGAPISVAPDHTLVVVVPGREFGDETAWLFDAADHLAGGSAPTIVVNGGRLTLDEAFLRLGQGHLVVAVEGTGRAADELAANEDLRASGKLRVIPVAVGESDLAEALEQPLPPRAENESEARGTSQ